MLARGDVVGPLHGLPITIKDAIETEGIRSTGGAVELADHVPAADAPAVARLKAAGAIVFGKTNLPRWCGDSQAFNELFGTTNNPWSLAHVPGGSSGGSAAALAAGFTGAELGTDIGGSVRAPAHCCGVYALKPSYGVVPNLGYLDHVGGGPRAPTSTCSVRWLDRPRTSTSLMSVLAGPSPDDAVAWRVELPESTVVARRAPGRDLARRRGLPGRRASIWRCCAARPTRSPMPARRSRTPIPRRLPRADRRVHATDRRRGVAELPGRRRRADLRLPPHVAPPRRAACRAAQDVGRVVRALRRAPRTGVEHTAVRARSGRRHDTTLRHGERRTAEPPRDLALADAREPDDQPSAVVPIGRTAAGLPVGMQIVAPYLHDRRAIRVAGLVSQVLGGYEVPPGFE